MENRNWAPRVAYVADLIQPPLVTSAKQPRAPCSGASNGFNELPEMHFEFPFILIGKSTRPIRVRQNLCPIVRDR